jgi:hypothetical protein
MVFINWNPGVPDMISHALPHGVSFWSFLLTIDQDLAERARQHGCACGGRLHCANYPRKPRGCPDSLPDEYLCRLSFCCDRDGCRKRVTPPSVRFLGRKVYLGAMVILVAAMRQGATPRRVHELSRLIGADRKTIARWLVFWQQHFPRTKFWKLARARLVPAFQIVAYPFSLLEAFVGATDDRQGWGNLLLFLSPITTARGLEIKVSDHREQPAEDAHRGRRSRKKLTSVTNWDS